MNEHTKYERARIIGARALQIGMGAPFLVQLGKEDLEKLKYNPIEIAKMEYEKGLVPISIKKLMPKPDKEEETKRLHKLFEISEIAEEPTDQETVPTAPSIKEEPE
jgi:DNA-directed RNA polymerase subunit K